MLHFEIAVFVLVVTFAAAAVVVVLLQLMPLLINTMHIVLVL